MSGKTIVMTSGKGGVGKTTATANVGTALALRSNRVVVIDTDIGLRNLDVVMGLENRIVYDLVDVVEERCRIEQALIRDKNAGELYLVAAAQTRDKDCITADQLVDLCRRLEMDFRLRDRRLSRWHRTGVPQRHRRCSRGAGGDDAGGIGHSGRRPGDRVAPRLTTSIRRSSSSIASSPTWFGKGTCWTRPTSWTCWPWMPSGWSPRTTG